MLHCPVAERRGKEKCREKDYREVALIFGVKDEPCLASSCYFLRCLKSRELYSSAELSLQYIFTFKETHAEHCTTGRH